MPRAITANPINGLRTTVPALVQIQRVFILRFEVFRSLLFARNPAAPKRARNQKAFVRADRGAGNETGSMPDGPHGIRNVSRVDVEPRVLSAWEIGNSGPGHGRAFYKDVAV